MRIVLCTGSRSWSDDELILSALDSIARPFRIIVGDAKDGADPMFWLAAAILDVPGLRFNAQWKLHGRSAGPKRNTVMVDMLIRLRAKGEKHCFGLAAWDGKSRGTKDTMDKLVNAKFDVWQVSNFKGGT